MPRSNKIVFKDASNSKDRLATITLYEEGINSRVYLGYAEIERLKVELEDWLSDHRLCSICHSVECNSKLACRAIAERESR